jgi:hypothetical protein
MDYNNNYNNDDYDDYDDYDNKYYNNNDYNEYDNDIDDYDINDYNKLDYDEDNMMINNMRNKKVNNKNDIINLLNKIRDNTIDKNDKKKSLLKGMTYKDKIKQCIKEKYENNNNNKYYNIYFRDIKLLENYSKYYINNIIDNDIKDTKLKETVFISYDNIDINIELMTNIIKYITIDDLSKLCMVNKNICRYKYIWYILIQKHFNYIIDDADIFIYIQLLFNYCINKEPNIIIDIFDCYYNSSINNDDIFIELIEDYINNKLYNNIHILISLYHKYNDMKYNSYKYNKYYINNTLKILYNTISNILNYHISIFIDNSKIINIDMDNNKQLWYNILIDKNIPVYFHNNYLKLYNILFDIYNKNNKNLDNLNIINIINIYYNT